MFAKKQAYGTFLHLWLVSGAGQSSMESGSCLFQTSAIQVLHIFCYIMGRVFYTSQASQYLYIVSNWCPPFNLTAAAEVLIVNTCDVCLNMCDECPCARQCVCWYLMSMKWMWRLQTSPYPLGWIGLAALNAQSLKSISAKAQHSGSRSVDQMYLCNFFVQWGCSLHWSSLSCCSQSAFASLVSPFCTRASVAHSYVRSLQVSCEKWSVCYQYRFALWIFCKFYPQKVVLIKYRFLCDGIMMCLVSGVVDTGKHVNNS